MADLFANNYSAQLASGCTNADTSLTLTAGVPTALQAGGQWRAMFSNGEIVIIPGGQAGPTVTGVTRGAEQSLGAPAATVHQQGEWLTHIATAGALGALVGAAAFGGTVVASPSGDTTGATDTAVIHAARTAAGANGTLLFQNGTYWITGLNATIAGQNWKLPAGCTIKQAVANAVIITVTAANVTLEGPGILDGNASVNTGASNFGIWLNNGSAGSTVRNLTIQNIYQAGILIYVAPVLVQGNTILNTINAAGIFAQPAGPGVDLPDIRVLDNVIDKSTQAPATAQGYGIQLHGGPNGQTFTATSSTITNPTVLTAVSSFTNLVVGVAITGTNIPAGATIASLNPGASTLTMTLPATASGSFTVSVQYALRGLVVSRNEVKLPLSPTNTLLGIECWGWTPGAVVAQNRLSGGSMGISLDRSDNGTVTSNSTEAATQQGIEIANCTNVTVTGNVCDGSVRGGSGITLDGLLTPSAKCTVTGNTIVRITNIGGQGGKAIFVITNGDHTTITGNVVNVPVGVNATGVYIQNSPSTTITGNVLFCASSTSSDAIVFEGSAASGGVVQANVIEGWPRSAVTLFVGSSGATSSPLTTSGAITSIPVNALAGAIPAGTVWIGSSANSQSQSFTTAGAAGGATSIPVTSQTPNFAYPAGSTITTTTPVVDRIVLGPNVFNSNGAVLTPVVAAVTGGRCRFVYAEQSQASPNVSAITVGASPFTYTNNDHAPEKIYMTGGTVSAVTKNAINIFTASPCSFLLETGEAVTVTYTVAPTMNKDLS